METLTKDKALVQKLNQIAGLQAEVLKEIKSKEESGDSWSVEAFNKLVNTPEIWEDSARQLESLFWSTNTKVV